MRIPWPVQVGKDGNRQCGTLGGIGTGSQLIKENQRLFIGLFPERNDICHMGGEGTQALFNALLIADIGKHFGKKCQFGMVESRDVQAWTVPSG